MDYYYALLESYDLLKKRKFKMSIVEQEDGKSQTASDIQGKAPAEKGPIDGYGDIQFSKSKDGAVVASAGRLNATIIDATGQPLEDSETAKKLWQMILGGDEGDGKGGRGEEEIDPVEQNIDYLLSVLDWASQQPGSPFYIDPTLGRGSSGAAARNRVQLYIAFLQGLKEGRPVELSRSELIEEVPNRITNDEFLDPQKKANIVNQLGRAITSYTNFQQMSPEERANFPDEELKKFSELFKVDESGGVLVDGIYVTYSTDSTARAMHPIRMMLDDIQEEINRRNKEYEDLEEPKPYIPNIEYIQPQTEGGSLYAKRGVIAEHLMAGAAAIQALNRATAAGDKAGAEKAKKQLIKILQDALANGSAEDILNMFSKGQKTLLAELLPTSDDAQDARTVDGIKRFLVKELNMDPEAVEDLVNACGEKLGLGLAVMLVVNKEFDEELHGDLEIVEAKAVGQEDSQRYGNKADVIVTYKCDDASCENVYAHFEKIMDEDCSAKVKEGISEGKGKGKKKPRKPLYSANMVDDPEGLKEKFPQVHPNSFYHHSTNEFKPDSLEGLPVGEKQQLKITGRLTTDKVDVLLVDNPNSSNPNPHITLSTADGVKPFESNAEIQANLDKIQPLDDTVDTTVGYNDGKDRTEPPEGSPGANPCGPGRGIRSIKPNPDGTISIPIELKTINDSQSDVAKGQSSHKRASSTFSPAAPEEERGMVKYVDDTLDSAREGASQNARKIQKEMNDTRDRLRQAENFRTAQGVIGGHDVVDRWVEKTKDPNKKKTARLAKSAMTKLSKGKPLGPEEQEALDLVQAELDQAVFGDQLKKSRTGGKTKNGYKVNQEMTDYVAHRFLMMCGTDGECLRVGRELGDRRQTCRSNNNDVADTSAKLASGEYTLYDSGSGRMRVLDKDGNVVETIVMTSTGLEVTKRASKYDAIKKAVKETVDLLHQFLYQQQQLLSKLLGERSDLVG